MRGIGRFGVRTVLGVILSCGGTTWGQAGDDRLPAPEATKVKEGRDCHAAEAS